MTAKFDTDLATNLAGAQTKLDWAARLQTALGPTMRLRMYRDASSTAEDPFVTGTEFLNVGIAGPFTIAAGNITNFGVLTGVTTNLAADLSTGSSCLRVEGNGHFMQYSLGRTGSGKDYQLSANPQGGNTGFAFVSNSGVRAPALLNSGTGPLAPPAANYTVDIQDWTTGAAVLAGTINMTNRLTNVVFDDAEMATSQGDIRMQIGPVAVGLGDVEFGAILWSANPSLNSQGSTPVDEIAIICKPKAANWPGYPRSSGYIAGTSNTFPPPFKAVIKKDGVVVKTHEMRDGLPINDPSLNQSSANSAISVKPIRPKWCCGMVLPWRSARHKMHTYADKYYPGQQQEILRGSQTRQKSSTNGANPLYYFRFQINGYNQWFALPKWALPANQTAFNSDVSQDPYLFNLNSGDPGYGPMSSGATRMTGWGYEPGSNGGHDHFTGPGGARIDRAAIAGPIAIHRTMANYTRPRGNEPIADLLDDWINNYCNIPNFLYTDVTTAATIPVDEVFKGMWAQGGRAYYGANDSYVSGGKDYTVNVFSITNGATEDFSKPYLGAFVDKNGQMPFNGSGTDGLHAYKSPFLVAALYNSPMFAHFTKHFIIMNILARLGDVAPNSNPRVHFLVRSQAWRLKNYKEAWKLSSDHPTLIPRKVVEDAWQLEMETINDQIVAPFKAGDQDPFIVGLRNFGVPFNKRDRGYWDQSSQSLTFYIAGVLQLMKGTGSLDMIYNKSANCKAAIDFMIRCMDIYTADWAIYTKGIHDWYDDSVYLPNADRGQDNAATIFRANWQAVAAAVPPSGPEDWIHNADGSLINERFDGSQHLRYQYLCIRRDWIKTTDVPWGAVNSLTDAIALFKGWYDMKAAQVASLVSSNASAFSIAGADWAVRQPSYGEIKPPVTV